MVWFPASWKLDEGHETESPPSDEEQLELFRGFVEQAARGGVRVRLFTKGARPMWMHREPRYGHNYFWIPASGQWRIIDVPSVCQMCGVDPVAVQEAFEYLGMEKIISTPGYDEQLLKELWARKRQVITDLFPFAQIEWFRESGTGSPWVLGRFTRNPGGLTPGEVREECRPGKAFAKARRRNWARRRKAA